MKIEIVHARRSDLNDILSLIKGIAEYEKLSDQVVADTRLLEEQLFDQNNAKVLLAKEDSVSIGFALYFYNFSTFKGKKGLYLEDLYIKPEYRNKGIGKRLFESLVEIAKQENCGRMEWVCLNWNQPAIEFYEKRKAQAMSDWTIFRLDESDF